MKRAQATAALTSIILVIALVVFAGTQTGLVSITGFDVFAAAAPSVDSIFLNSTFATNTSSENLTVYWTVSDSDGDGIINITDWRVDGKSIALLNLPFENFTNSTLNTSDYTTYGRDGIVSGATPTIYGARGAAYSFDGVNDVITFGTVPIVPVGGQNYTVCAWFNTSTQAPGAYEILSQWTFATSANAFFFGFRDGDNWCFSDSWCSAGAGTIDIGPWSTNQWHHACGVSTSTDAYFYFDGALAATLGSALTYTGQGPLVIGTQGENGNEYWNGGIDEVLIYNRSLSSEQIALIYQNRTDLISSQETKVGETWSAAIIPNDGTEDGVTAISNDVTIINARPVVSNVILNSTFATNTSSENLTVYWFVSDPDGDKPLINITDWRINGRSIALLNTWFENTSNFGDGSDVNVTDYSTYARNGTVVDTIFNASCGLDGGGCYQFDGSDDIVTFSKNGLFTTVKTINFFVKFTNAGLVGIVGQTTCGVAAGWFFAHAYGGGAGTISFYDVAQGTAITGGSGVNNDEWRMITGKLNGTHQNLYVDGIQVASASYSGTTTDGGNPLTLGGLQPTFCGFGVGWYEGKIDRFSIYNRSISDSQILLWNSTRTSNSMTHSSETARGENWSVTITPNDGFEDGSSVLSNSIVITNSLSAVSGLSINSTFGTNGTDENLTAFWSVADVDGDRVINITDWRINRISIAVLNMPFENHSNAANNATNYATTNRNGSVSGAMLNKTAGRSGHGAYQFDGTDDNIEVTLPGIITGANPRSVSLWMNPDAAQSRSVFGYGGLSADELFDVLLIGGIVGIHWAGNGVTTEFSNTAYTVGSWQHVVFTYNGTTIKSYINGVNKDTVTKTLSTASSAVRIGDGFFGIYRFFDGFVDDVVLFNRTLSPEQVLALNASRNDFIVSQETDIGDRWQAAITPNDGVQDGAIKLSNNLTIVSNRPIVSNVILNSTHRTNLTTDNLTVYWTVTDAEGDSIINITDWRVDGTSIAVLNMPFEADGRQNTTDYSAPYQSNGTAVDGVLWKSDSYGGYYSFDGIDDYIDIPDVDELDFTNNMTVIMRIQTATSQVGSTDIFSKHNVGNTAYVLEQTGGDPNSYLFGWGAGSFECVSDGLLNLTPGVWQYAVIVKNGTTAISYIDGKKQGTCVGASAAIGTNGLNLQISRWSGSGGRHWKGNLSEFRIYNRSLSIEQILYLNSSKDAVLSHKETQVGDRWQAAITPNDGVQDGATKLSNNVTIIAEANNLPVVSSVILNSTHRTNLTTDNLTAYWSVSDADGDRIVNITDWRVNSVSTAILNLPFENSTNSANNVTDYSTYRKNGSVANGATWTRNGYLHGAYDFDGIDDYLEFSHFGAFNSPQITITGWFNSDILSDTSHGIVSKAYNIAPYFAIWTQSDNTLAYEWANPVSTFDKVVSTASLTTNKWIHFAVVHNGTTVRIYLNGRLNASATSSLSYAVTHNTNTFRVGALHAGFVFNGKLDEIRIYNRTLSAQQIFALYQNRTDLIVSQETNLGERWQAAITPNDGREDGLTKLSNNVTIITAPSPGGGSGGGGGGGSLSVPVCSPSWSCTTWSVCSNDRQTRTCVDVNNCGTSAGKPIETQPAICVEEVFEKPKEVIPVVQAPAPIIPAVVEQAKPMPFEKAAIGILFVVIILGLLLSVISFIRSRMQVPLSFGEQKMEALVPLPETKEPTKGLVYQHSFQRYKLVLNKYLSTKPLARQKLESELKRAREDLLSTINKNKQGETRQK